MTTTRPDPYFTSNMDVALVDSMGDDHSIVHAARVSTMGSRADDLGDLDLERFISFLVHNRHGSPFEHVSFTFRISAPIFVWREFMRHRMACVSGDTVITFCSPDGKSKTYQTIAEYYENRKVGTPDMRFRSGGKVRYRKRTKDYVFDYTHTDDDGGRTAKIRGPWAQESEAYQALSEFRTEPWRRRILPSVINKKAISIDEETGAAAANTVLDVFQSGVKTVYEVVTEQGDTIKTTMDHRFRTDDGYKKLADLSVGDKVHVFGVRGVYRRDPLVSKELRRGIGHWAQMVRQCKYDKDELYPCYMCNKELTWREMELDHVIPVVLDLSLALTESNLSPACRECHRKKTTSEQVYRHRGRTTEAGAKSAYIKSITLVGEEMTYDISMEAPNNNFIGNNFVVHNSYNEESGRYKVLEPRFYVPNDTRNLVQVGKTGAYRFLPGSPAQTEATQASLTHVSCTAYNAYRDLLDLGVAKEVARMALPLNIYSTAYVTMNLRALTNFLSLRVQDSDSMFPSFPQREIEDVALQMEALASRVAPVALELFDANGRVPL